MFENQFDGYTEFQEFIKSLTRNINNIHDHAEDVLEELDEVEEVALESPKAYTSEEIEEAQGRIEYIYGQINVIRTDALECEQEYNEFEMANVDVSFRLVMT